MIEILIKLMEQLNGAVFVLVAILLIAFWAVYKIGTITTLFGGYKEERKELKDDIRQIKNEVAKITATTDLLYQTHLSTVQSHSPLSLTQKGKDISSELSIENKIIVNWEKIKNKIEEKSPSNPYDIQTVTMDMARNCFSEIFSEADRNEIKTYAYKIGMNLLEIIPIIGILIRDHYLKEKNIPVAEIDKHVPTK